MLLTVLESPYAGDIEKNIAYARRCLRDSLKRDEAPIASHLLYTQDTVLSDSVPEERIWGISAGHAWIARCDQLAVYTDLGVTQGMASGIEEATRLGIPIKWRRLDEPSLEAAAPLPVPAFDAEEEDEEDGEPLTLAPPSRFSPPEFTPPVLLAA